MTDAHPSPDLSVAAMREWEKLPEGIRAEVIYGKLYILPFATRYHADIVMRITHDLMNHVIDNELGLVYNCGVGVYLLDGANVVGPDVVFISKNNPFAQLDRKGIFGPSDLHIEVLSPSNRRHDLVRKKKLYEEAGVKEYWIIDPDTKVATGYLLENGGYSKPVIMKSKIHIRILDKDIIF